MILRMNTEKAFQNAVWVAVVMVLMFGLEVTVWADEEDERKEMKDFLGGFYGGKSK